MFAFVADENEEIAGTENAVGRKVNSVAIIIVYEVW